MAQSHSSTPDRLAGLVATLLLASILVLSSPPHKAAVAQALPQPDPAGTVQGVLRPARDTQPVILTGAQIPQWSRLSADGTSLPLSGSFDGVRSAHHGNLVEPPDARKGADVDKIAAYKWDGLQWVEIPVQVDERFPYFLANARSDFAPYSHTDRELSYEWDFERWKMVAGQCEARYPTSTVELNALRSAGVITPGGGETLNDYSKAMQDPVGTLDDDDEIVFMASDAGSKAPDGSKGPFGLDADTRQEIALTDPNNNSLTSYVYLFQKAQGSPRFNKDNGYVRYQRHENANQWLDKASFQPGSTEQLGSSNSGYGPNIPGSVCTYPPDATQLGAPRDSEDRFPRDGVTVTTDSYEWAATGRWMIRQMRVANGDADGYGEDLVDRFKGRAFQQSPDSSISIVGFEDEQVNWEANSAVLGERMGPVRAIREVWGADSGTNVTRRDIFYRDAVAYHFFLRVHPIPPDGIYSSWDHNSGVAVKYYNALHPEGVDVDGKNDDVGQIDQTPDGRNMYFDAPDPLHQVPSATHQWEQVSGSGNNGSLVYTFEPKNVQSFENPLFFPYYRDDKNFDDGTGDDPAPRPWPGEPTGTVDARLEKSGELPYSTRPPEEKQGAWGTLGVHFFVVNDTDNAFTPVPVTEAEGIWWQFPTREVGPAGEPYAQAVRTPIRAVATGQENEPGEPPPSPSPSPTTTATASPSPSPSPSASPTTTASPSPSPSPGSPTSTARPSPASPASPAASPAPTSTASPRPMDHPPPPGPPPPRGPRRGYWLAGEDGGVFSFGDSEFHGSAAHLALAAPISGMAAQPGGGGYWLAGRDGGVFSFGEAGYHGSMGGTPLAGEIVGIASTPSGLGYWLVGEDGGVFAFGDAGFYGSAGGMQLNGRIVAITPTPNGLGYWLLAEDGGVFSFGNASFNGSMGATPLRDPVTGGQGTPMGSGYWLNGSDVGVFTFGDGRFHGSRGDQPATAPAVGMSSPTIDGYWIGAEDGGVFTFGDLPFLGSAAGMPLRGRIVEIASLT